MDQDSINDIVGKPAGRRQSFHVNGDLLRVQRLAKGWTQLDAASASGLSERLVRDAESGGPIHMKSIRFLAGALEVPVAAILKTERRVDTAPSTAEAAKRFLEQIWNHANLSVIDELLLPTFRFYHESGVVCDREEMRSRILTFRESFSEFDFRVEDVRIFGEFVICRWTVSMTHTGPWLSLSPSHRRATVFGASWVQVVDGKFGDAWDFWDPEALYRQLID